MKKLSPRTALYIGYGIEAAAVLILIVGMFFIREGGSPYPLIIVSGALMIAASVLQLVFCRCPHCRRLLMPFHILMGNNVCPRCGEDIE